MYYTGILLIFVTYSFKFPEESIVSEEVRFAFHNSHGKAFLIFQVKSFIRSYCVVRVEPYRPSAKNISKIILSTLDMFNCIAVDLKVCFDV